MAREQTKKFEQIMRGKVTDLKKKIETHTVRGEIVIVVEGFHKKLPKDQAINDD